MSDAVKAGLALLSATFRAELDAWQVRAYQRALKGVPADVLLVAADRLIDQAASGRKFFPLPTAPDWKGACAVILEERRRAAFLMGLEGCDHSSQFEEFTDKYGVIRMRRCACYQRGQALMAAVGALALPSYTEPENTD